MNIIVQPHGSQLCYCRPDTTWERENKDFYVPDSVTTLQWAPVVFIRISKAGKCIGRKFASRYFDAFNFGALMYGIPACGTNDRAFTSCMDHTSILPSPLYNTIVMEQEDNIYKVCKNGQEIYSVTTAGLLEKVEEVVCAASKFTSLRIGDYVAVELTPLADLSVSEEGSAAVKGSFCGNQLFDFKILF